MAFTAPIRDSHLFIGFNDKIGSVKPPRGVSKSGRSEELAKVIKRYSPVKIRIAEDTCWGSIKGSGIAPVQDSDSLRCYVVYSHGPENNQHCEGNTRLRILYLLRTVLSPPREDSQGGIYVRRKLMSRIFLEERYRSVLVLDFLFQKAAPVHAVETRAGRKKNRRT
jgi:hypothetical protein